MTQARAKPLLALIVLGGTISGALDEGGMSVPTLDGEELARAVPQVGELADFTVPETRKIGSHALTPKDFSALAHLAAKAIKEGCDGVVITQGTDTLEETAYALALQLRPQVPVVLTGAMRNPTLPGADGPGNLLGAIRVATTREAGSLGPLVVFHDEIHNARWVMKSDSTGLAAFSSPGAGRVGTLVEQGVHLSGRISTSDYVALPANLEPRVDIVWTYAGCDGQFVDSADADGLVIAAMGGGHVPPRMMDSLRKVLARGVPVVVASRCASGGLLTSTYAGPGTEGDLLDAGVCPAGQLHPLKARLRLLVALAAGKRSEEVFPV